MKKRLIKKHLTKHKKTFLSLFNDKNLQKKIEDVTDLLINTFSNSNKLMIAGNGGSAADAQHIAAELIGKLNLKRKALPAIALNTDTSILTSISNDYHFSEIFSRQIEGIGKIDDIFLGITTSGKSKNILKAIKSAKDKKIKVIILTGKKGVYLKKYSDVCIAVPSSSTQIIQEMHITILHIICEIVEQSFK